VTHNTHQLLVSTIFTLHCGILIQSPLSVVASAMKFRN